MMLWDISSLALSALVGLSSPLLSSPLLSPLTSPPVAARSAASVADSVTDTVPIAQVPLTVESLSKLTTFWKAFIQHAEDVQESREAQRATDLAKAHLTASEYARYQRSLAAANLQDPYNPDTTLQTSATPGVLRRNVAFLRAHPTEFEALLAAGMWVRHAPLGIGQPARQLTVQRWLNDSQHRGPRTTFGDGRIYVLDFTAFWCLNCPATYPVMTAIRTKYPTKTVQVLYVVNANDRAAASPAALLKTYVGYSEKLHLGAPMAFVSQGEIAKYSEEMLSFPMMFVIDGAGKLQGAYRGADDENLQAVAAKVDELVVASAASSR